MANGAITIYFLKTKNQQQCTWPHLSLKNLRAHIAHICILQKVGAGCEKMITASETSNKSCNALGRAYKIDPYVTKAALCLSGESKTPERGSLCLHFYFSSLPHCVSLFSLFSSSQVSPATTHHRHVQQQADTVTPSQHHHNNNTGWMSVEGPLDTVLLGET